MVKLIPEAPSFATGSERVVWERLASGLGTDDVLIANLRLTDEAKDHELDFVVLMPDLGVCVLEVKGGSVWYDDGWWSNRDRTPTRIHPVEQARDGEFALRRYVQQDPRWGSRGRVVFAHGVVTPYSMFPPEFSLPDLQRWMLHDRDDMNDLIDRVRETTWGLSHGCRVPSHDDIDVVVDILTGRLTVPDPEADASEREARADRLTQEQAMILNVTRLLNRVEIRGGAGSGKTVLALTQAKQLTAGGRDRPAQRVALLCYSIGLAEHLKRQVAGWKRQHRPAFVGTFHELGVSWGAPQKADRTRSDFWEVELPELMADLAGSLDHGHKFDSIIVDEAQDFADLWWKPLMAALRDEENGGVFVYSDEHQRLFPRFGRPPVSLVPLVLDENLRNTKQIHEAFRSLAPSHMRTRGSEGPQVQFVPAGAADVLDAGDDQIDQLIDQGWSPGAICLLTTGARHPEQVARTEQLDQAGYWATFWDPEQVFYGHVLGSKGLERRVVVLCFNEKPDGRERAKERLYVGMSRATDQLIVVGDPDVIRAVGGESIARRLGID